MSTKTTVIAVRCLQARRARRRRRRWHRRQAAASPRYRRMGRIWQASRMPGVAPMRDSALASRPAGSGKPLEALGHQNAAGGAARPPAAHRGVGDAMGAQRLEHGGAGQDRHAASVGMRQHRRPAAAIVPVANAAAGKRQQRQSRARCPSRYTTIRLIAAMPSRREIGIVERRIDEIGIGLGLAQHLIAAGDIAGERQRSAATGRS